MKTRLLRFGFVILAMVLAGCTALQRPAPGPTTRVEASRADPGANARIQEMEQVSTLINYAQNIAAMTAEEQRREFAGINQAHTREPSTLSRVKLALLLCTPGVPFQDDNRALGLLEPLAAGASSASGPLRRFAGLLHAQVGERVREQKRSAVLREQLDALKAIERQLIERGQGRTR